MTSALHWGRTRDLPHTEPSPCIPFQKEAVSERGSGTMRCVPLPLMGEDSGEGAPTDGRKAIRTRMHLPTVVGTPHPNLLPPAGEKGLLGTDRVHW